MTVRPLWWNSVSGSTHWSPGLTAYVWACCDEEKPIDTRVSTPQFVRPIPLALTAEMADGMEVPPIAPRRAKVIKGLGPDPVSNVLAAEWLERQGCRLPDFVRVALGLSDEQEKVNGVERRSAEIEMRGVESLAKDGEQAHSAPRNTIEEEGKAYFTYPNDGLKIVLSRAQQNFLKIEDAESNIPPTVVDIFLFSSRVLALELESWLDLLNSDDERYIHQVLLSLFMEHITFAIPQGKSIYKLNALFRSLGFGYSARGYPIFSVTFPISDGGARVLVAIISPDGIEWTSEFNLRHEGNEISYEGEEIEKLASSCRALFASWKQMLERADALDIFVHFFRKHPCFCIHRLDAIVQQVHFPPESNAQAHPALQFISETNADPGINARKPLSPLAQDILLAHKKEDTSEYSLLPLKAGRGKQGLLDALEKMGRSPDEKSAKCALRELRVCGFILAKRGQGGGGYLTDLGRVEAEKIHAAR